MAIPSTWFPTQAENEALTAVLIAAMLSAMGVLTPVQTIVFLLLAVYTLPCEAMPNPNIQEGWTVASSLWLVGGSGPRATGCPRYTVASRHTSTGKRGGVRHSVPTLKKKGVTGKKHQMISCGSHGADAARCSALPAQQWNAYTDVY